MERFVESGMTFSFDEDDIFYIEQSKHFTEIKGAMPCECVVLHNGNVLLIEAKSSTPRPNNKERFEKFVGEIVQKFSDSYTYYCAAHQKRHPSDELGHKLQTIPLEVQQFEFYLIINGHQRSWLPPVLDQLKKMMKKNLKLWGFNDACVKVVNEELAFSKGLIISYNEKQSSK